VIYRLHRRLQTKYKQLVFTFPPDSAAQNATAQRGRLVDSHHRPDRYACRPAQSSAAMLLKPLAMTNRLGPKEMLMRRDDGPLQLLEPSVSASACSQPADQLVTQRFVSLRGGDHRNVRLPNQIHRPRYWRRVQNNFSGDGKQRGGTARSRIRHKENTRMQRTIFALVARSAHIAFASI
jgi:hypothetical protein